MEKNLFHKRLFWVFALLAWWAESFAQTYNDGPIQLRVRVRDIATNFNATDIQQIFPPDEMTYFIWARDNADVDGSGWLGGQCLTANFAPPGNSPDFNTMLLDNTYTTATVPQFFDIRTDFWEDDSADPACGGNRCNFESNICCGVIVFGACVGFSQEDDERCNANPFRTNMDYRLGPPCQWYDHGYVTGACGSRYQPHIESFWRYTRGTDCNTPIVLGPLPSGGSLTHFNSNECYTNNFSASPGKDVFYQFTISAPTGVIITLCGGTAFNTVLYLVDASCNQIAANDNFCGIVSQITTNICTPGTYKVIVDGALANSQGTFTLLITDDPSALLSVNVTKTDVTCNGGNDGTATASPVNGTAPYTYSWSPNVGNTQTVTGLSAGTYSVTVTDFTGCTASGSVVIGQPAVLSFTATVIPPTCNDGTNGIITVTASGGTQPYQYSSDGGNIFQNSNVLTGLAGGTYTVVVKDANNCRAQNPVTITAPPAIDPNLTVTNITCYAANDGSVTSNPINGTPPYTYSLDNGPFVSTNTFSGIGISGLHILTVKDANGCTASAPFLITEPADLSSVISAVTSLTCNGSGDGSFVVTGSGGTPPYQYSLDDVAYQPSGSFTGLSAGSYNVYVKDANGCKDVNNVTISQPAPLVASVLFQINIQCHGSATDGVVVLTASGGTPPYLFSDDHFFYDQSGFFDRLAGGTYTYYVKDANNCEDSVTFTIFEPAPLSLTIGNVSNATCLGVSDGSITLHASGGTPPYMFSINGGAFRNDSVFTGLTAGSYDFTVRDDNFCELTQSLTIGFTTAIILNISQTNITCSGSSSGSIGVIASNGQPPYSYSIDGVTFGPQNIFSGLPAGNYTVTVRDNIGCLATADVTLTEPGPLAVTLVHSSPARCFNTSDGSADIDVMGGEPPYTFLWSNGSTTQNLANVPAGDYTVVVTDASSCTATLTVTVAGTPPLFVDIESFRNVSCNGEQDAYIDVKVVGGTIPYTYLWSNGSQTEDIIDIGPGSYRLTVVDANNCSLVETYSITSPPGLFASIEAIANATCKNGNDGSITISATGGTAPLQYSIDGFSFQSSPVFDGLSAGVYPVVVKDDIGCRAATSVTVEDGADIFYSYGNDKDIINGQSIPLSHILIPEDTAGVTVSWEPAAGLSCSDCLDPVASPVITTVYTATLTNADGCVAKAVIRVAVRDDWQIYLPNIFTPNFDGNNDNFDYEGYGISNVEVRIFNRYGGQVYYNPSQVKGKGFGWDGMYNGKEAQQGAYAYLINVLFTNNELRQKTGTITLIR